MDVQLIRLLTETQAPQEQPRKHAEWQLRQLYTNPDFPAGLLGVAAHDDVPVNVRQSALLVLKTFVQACWSLQFDEYGGQLFADESRKSQIRQALLNLAIGEHGERKVKSAASLVVSKIATADFPEEWPELLPTVLRVIESGADMQLHGALKVLLELVDDCFNDEQFFSVAQDLVKVVHGVAVNQDRKPILRALAISVFRSCFDTLEMVMEDNKAAVKGFAEQTLASWMPFFSTVLKSPLPPSPNDEGNRVEDVAVEHYRGWVALKLQAVKVLMRVRSLFPSILSPHSVDLFSATWQELSAVQASYHQMYIADDRQGRLEDADGLPYTLDFLVLEELDFMQACLRAPPVRKELEKQLQAQSGNVATSWTTEVMKIAVAYAQITTEEEGMWDIDVNVFLSEETNVTANYTPRTACGDLVIRLGEWLNAATMEGLLTYTQTLYTENSAWKAKEAALYLLSQLLGDLQDGEKTLGPDFANGYVAFIQHALQEEEVFLRARGYLVAGSLTRTSGTALQSHAATFMDASIRSIAEDPSDIVKVSCIRALQYYLVILPQSFTLGKQSDIVRCLSNYIHEQDFSDLADSDDLLITIIETLRDAIMIDPRTCMENGSLDLLFTLANQGASNFQIGLLVTEIFEDVVERLTDNDPNAYAQLSSKVLPSLMGAFDVASLKEESDLANLAADMLAVLAGNGPSPLPAGFVSSIMPRVTRLLLESQHEELLKSSTTVVKHVLSRDAEQVFSYHDKDGKSGLEVILIIIDRLLSPTVEDNGAAEVGGLAAELVEKAGAERLGPFLSRLPRAVAVRLESAVQDQFIQSLIIVFARLSLISALEVVNFLAELQIGDGNGLEIVIRKWLENTINFAGYDDIRQNIIALTRIYELDDPRIAQIQVKGDLIVPQSDRIMTRSRARQVPDQYTMISAQIKIVKVLVEELMASQGNQDLGAAGTKGGADDDDDDNDDDDDDEWEDDPNDFVDLASGMTKSQLMAYAADDVNAFSRGRDDETQAHLVQFFQRQAQNPQFGTVFNTLNAAEQEKLRNMQQV